MKALHVVTKQITFHLHSYLLIMSMDFYNGVNILKGFVIFITISYNFFQSFKFSVTEAN